MPRVKREAGEVPLTPADEIAEVASSEADALYEQLLAAQRAPEPGLQAGAVVGKTIDDQNGTLAVPMVAAQIESAGYTVVYDRRTGESSVVNNNMLRQALAKLDPLTGKQMFTLRPPGIVPFEGKLKCRLHADDAERAVWDEMGLPVCDKANLRTKQSVTRHMETRHRQEWKAIKEREADIERAEQRLERKALLSLVTGGKVGVPETAA